MFFSLNIPWMYITHNRGLHACPFDLTGANRELSSLSCSTVDVDKYGNIELTSRILFIKLPAVIRNSEFFHELEKKR